MTSDKSAATRLIAAGRQLCSQVASLRFGPPVAVVYNPLVYARRPYERYLELYGAGPKRVVFVGMNPGPFGMAQTGVPFGEVAAVRDFLKVQAPVDAPAAEHPKRPVTGFACPRSEVSGRRLWGAIQAFFGTPERFFVHHFVANYCPLVFIEESGRNRTPDKLPAAEKVPLFAACNAHLRRTVQILRPEWVIGIGAFAEARAREALQGMDVRVGRVLHPSPASPAANRGWRAQARAAIEKLGLCAGKCRRK